MRSELRGEEDILDALAKKLNSVDKLSTRVLGFFTSHIVFSSTFPAISYWWIILEEKSGSPYHYLPAPIERDKKHYCQQNYQGKNICGPTERESQRGVCFIVSCY